MGLLAGERSAGQRARSVLALGVGSLLLGAGLAGAQVPDPANRVIRDRSLGDNTDCPPAPAPCLVPTMGLNWNIEAAFGQTMGDNLFHSFSFFDIAQSWRARFLPGASIPSNVITRVTGGDPSDIAGILDTSLLVDASGPGAPRRATLFLLNPAGVMFTDASSLDLAGSLYASTADVLRFGPGEADFPAVAEQPIELSGADPVSFGFLSDVPAPIVISRAGAGSLEVPDGATFALVGGDITITGNGNASADVAASGGTIALAAAGPNSDVPVGIASFRAEDAAVDALGSILIQGMADLEAGSATRVSRGGSVVVRGGRLELLEASTLQANNWTSDDVSAGGVDIALAGRTAGGAVEGLTVRGESDLSISVAAIGSGDMGGIRVVAPRIDVDDGARVSTTAFGGDSGDIELSGDVVRIGDTADVLSDAAGSSRAGDISITATDALILEAGGAAVSRVGQFGSTADAVGGAVTVNVEAGGVDISGGSVLSSRLLGAGTAGDVTVTAAQGVVVSGLGEISSVAGATAPAGATAGNVTIAAASVSVSSLDAVAGTSQISAVTQGQADGGNLTVRTEQLELRDGGQLRATTEGAGRAGDITIGGLDAMRPLESIRIAGVVSVGGDPAPAGIFARSADLATGDAGNLQIDAQSLAVENGGEISTRSLGPGRAGTITIRAPERVAIRGGSQGGGRIESQGGAGGAGTINIETDVLAISGGGQASVTTLGEGDAGGVTIKAREVTVTGRDGFNRSGILAQTVGDQSTSGDAGSIEMEVSESLTVADGGRISVESRGGGAAGDIEIRGTERVTVTGEDSEISARVQEVEDLSASADVILEDIGRLEVSEGGEITAETTGTGLGGDIRVVARNEVRLQDGGRITAESTGEGNAGNIDIDAGRRFVALRNSPEPGQGVVSTRSEESSGGKIRIQASELIYLSDSRIETQVAESGADGDGGDFGTPVLPDAEGEAVRPAELVVLNRSRIVASATAGDGGSILVGGTFLPSDALQIDEDLASLSDSALDATSETGQPGVVVVTSPASELAGQVVPLPSNYLDASKLLLTPCAARRSRAGSFTVQLEAVDPPPDAPFTAASLPPGASGDALESCGDEETKP